MHHAYLYEGSQTVLQALARDARERFGFEGEHNPDVQIQTFEKFGIEEARELSSEGALRSISGRALYIIGVSQINSEAQQALLKLFEEPQKGVIYVLLAPHGSIIPTLRSRFLEYQFESGARSPAKFLRRLAPQPTSPETSCGTFLSLPQKSRSAEIAKILKDDEGVRERVREFLNGLEASLYSSLNVRPRRSSTKEIIDALEDISKIRSYANDRSPSFKMLLEHLALSLPKL
jgi:DNA polymerase III delta prime subunit